LWIVCRGAETLGCSVQLRSRPGRGSRFTVALPLAPPQD
jgi:signal transduction histidine kinase